jgi:hypothetical protein
LVSGAVVDVDEVVAGEAAVVASPAVNGVIAREELPHPAATMSRTNPNDHGGANLMGSELLVGDHTSQSPTTRQHAGRQFWVAEA